MGAFGVMIGMLHYAGLYVQINSAFKTVGFGEVDNYLTGNGNLYTPSLFQSIFVFLWMFNGQMKYQTEL